MASIKSSPCSGRLLIVTPSFSDLTQFPNSQEDEDFVANVEVEFASQGDAEDNAAKLYYNNDYADDSMDIGAF